MGDFTLIAVEDRYLPDVNERRATFREICRVQALNRLLHFSRVHEAVLRNQSTSLDQPSTKVHTHD